MTAAPEIGVALAPRARRTSATRVGVLSNLRAGLSLKRRPEILEVLRGYPEVLYRETETGAMLPEALAAFEDEGVELLVVSGGDGSVQRVLTELLAPGATGWLPLLAPLRSGGTNMIACEIGVQRHSARALADLLAAAARGRIEERTVTRHVVRVDIEGCERPQYGTFFAAGMLYRAIELAQRLFPPGPVQGIYGAGLTTGVLLFRAMIGHLKGVLDPDEVSISIDGEPAFPGEYTLVMATTLGRLFMGMRPFWGEGSRPLRFTTLSAGARKKPVAVTGVLRGNPPRWATPELGYMSRNASSVVLRADCGVVLDGELFPAVPGRSVRLSADEQVRLVRS